MKFYRLSDGSIVASFTGSINDAEALVANTVDAAQEKHVPDVKVDGTHVSVQVGSVEHPMTEEHDILFVAVETKSNILIKEFNPGDKPFAEFELADGDEVVATYEYCSLHGLWKA